MRDEQGKRKEGGEKRKEEERKEKSEEWEGRWKRCQKQ